MSEMQQPEPTAEQGRWETIQMGSGPYSWTLRRSRSPEPGGYYLVMSASEDTVEEVCAAMNLVPDLLAALRTIAENRKNLDKYALMDLAKDTLHARK